MPGGRRLASAAQDEPRNAAVHDKVPAVVLGGRIGGLGMTRSLRADGVPVFVVDKSRRSPAMFSAGVRPIVVRNMDGPTLVTALLGVRSKMAEDPVMLLSDESAVLAVSRNRNDLNSAFRFVLPSAQTVETLMDKGQFQALAEVKEFPVPRSISVRTEGELSQLGNLKFPAVIKPVDKRDVHAGRARRIVRVTTIEQAYQVCSDAVVRLVPVIVQEWVSGPDTGIYFCLFYANRSGDILSAFSGRKLWAYPPSVGSTGVCMAALEVHDQLLAITRRFVDSVGLVGLGGLEFKWDAARRHFVIIEPTVGRIDQQEEIATLCGENIPLIAYRDALGLPYKADAPVSYRGGDVIWRELAAFFAISQLKCTCYDGFWRRDDPMPAVSFYICNPASLLWRFLLAYDLVERLYRTRTWIRN